MMNFLQKQQSSSTKRTITSSFDDSTTNSGDGHGQNGANDEEACTDNENTPLLSKTTTTDGGEEEEDEEQVAAAGDTTTTATACCCCCCCGGVLDGGTIRVAIGAMLFAATNAAATALYRRKGATVVSLYAIRAPIVYLVNAILAATVLEKEEEEETPQTNHDDNNRRQSSMIQVATNILLLRTGTHAGSRLALLRAFINSIKAVMLSVGFVYLTYSDAFVIYKGISVCGTIVVSRLVLGNTESLRWSELFCGGLVVGGILLINYDPTPEQQQQQQSTELSTDDASNSWMPRQTAGAIVVALSGLLSAFSGTLMRALSSKAGPHKLSPSMLLSYLMVVMFFVNGIVAWVVRPMILVKFIPTDSAWDWTQWIWPNDNVDWLLLLTNCTCTLVAHLATAAGYQTTRAGIVAFLQLTEIPWVYLMDVTLLDESTTLLKTLGSTVVFISAVTVALIRTTRNNNNNNNRYMSEAKRKHTPPQQTQIT